jgi:MerR family transcriptional regulator, heat shock protein HspR
MRFFGIDFVAHELGVHPSSLRRWEDHGLISPERVAMGKTTLRISDKKNMRVLRRAKELMDSGMSVSDAFGRARDEIEQREEQHND